ncbi:hypothetical protein BaRGS_00005621 [Batillaria attramentaria]|uniref:ABC-2 type transporter transmembrane domain-containing protein n=1 Tax=Batillaria attramentaria TaxID=370345 RepID=A0ABD0LUT3_9CAEN
MSKFFNQLGLLLWKNVLLQNKKKCALFFEIVLPLLFAWLLGGLRTTSENLMPQEKDAVIYEPRHIYEQLPWFNLFIHVPNTSLAKAIMSKTMARMDNIRSNRGAKVIKGLNTESELDDYRRDNPDNRWLAVVFNNLGKSTTLPKHVTFTLRPPEHDRYTDEKYNIDFTEYIFPPDNQITEYHFRGWLAMQSLLSETLISMWSGKDIHSNFSTVKMPFPAVVEDFAIRGIGGVLPTFFVYSFIVSVFQTTKSVVYEKERRIKESMKLMGMLPSAYWASWFLIFYIYLCLAMALNASFLCGTFLSEMPLLRDCDISLYVAFLMSNVAASASAAVFFVCQFPASMIPVQSGYQIKMAASLLFNTALSYGATAIADKYREAADGIRWSNFDKPTYPNTVSVLDAMLMLVVDTVMHLIVTWYMDAVFPGEFGVPQPYLFFLTVSLAFSSRSTASAR